MKISLDTEKDFDTIKIIVLGLPEHEKEELIHVLNKDKNKNRNLKYTSEIEHSMIEGYKELAIEHEMLCNEYGGNDEVVQ